MTEPGLLVVEGLAKTFRDARGGRREPVVAVDDVSFRVEPGQFFTLLGPSGCGKTTTLRCIAGLEQPDAGAIALGARGLFSAADGVNIAPQDRGIGLVFQSFAVWPHMTVEENVAFPLAATPRRHRLSKAQIGERVERALATIRLEGIARRPAVELSGGQQQRLALARALVMEPPLLLLDEPLSNLDARLRDEMRLELQRLQREVGVTALYVTHDQVEALAMSTAIAVMKDGRIEQTGTPRDIYDEPRSRFVAEFIGAANILPGVLEHNGGSAGARVLTSAGPVDVTERVEAAVGARVAVVVRPEDLEVRSDPAGDDAWRGTVVAVAFLGDALEYVIELNGFELRARGHRFHPIATGSEVALAFRGRPTVVSLE